MLLRLAISQMLFGAFFQFSNLFMNTYFFRLHQDAKIVAQYNFYMFLAWGLFFYVGFKCCERNTRIGIAVSGLTCLTAMVFLLMGSTNTFWLGLFMGASGGFFWPSYLSIYRTLGKRSEGSSTFAKVSVLASAVSIFIPILFGHLVAGKGYVVGFIVLIILSLGMVGMSLLMPAVKTQKIALRRNSFHHSAFIATNALQGVYFSFIGIAAGLLVFMTGEGEAGVGMFATFYGVLTLAVNIMMGYLLPQRYSALAMFAATIIYIVCSTLFLTEFDHRIIVFNFLIAGAGPLYANPVIGLQFSYINHRFLNGEEGLLMREFALSIGRLLFFGYMALFGMEVGSLWFYVFLFTASAFPFAIFLISRNWDKSAPDL